MCLSLPDDAYVEIVKRTHENGGDTGSIGYRHEWSLDEARKNILRTHTTAVSARMLKQIADEVYFVGRQGLPLNGLGLCNR